MHYSDHRNRFSLGSTQHRLERMNYLEELSDALREMYHEMRVSHDNLMILLHMISYARNHNEVIYVAGNGGSYTNALHWALDLQKAAGLKTHALGANAGVLTAWSNDLSYQDALAAEFDRLRGNDHALLVCLSCSGVSQNIESLIDYAVTHKIPSVLITGNHDRGSAFHVIRIPSTDYRVIEDCCMAIGHWLVGELQNELHKSNTRRS